MYDDNITMQTMADFIAEGWELNAPTDEEMADMYADAQARGLAV